MKRYQYVAVLGMMLIVAGMLVLMAPVMAQDEEGGASVPARPEVLTGYYDAWVNSGHADVTAEAFNHWNEDDPQEVSTSCATCHSTPGYIDFLGADDSEAGVVDVAPPIGTTVTCDACHNPVAANMSEVTFPSGQTITTEDNAARCMVCHQGRASGASVAGAIGEDPDWNAVNEELGFINIHYYAAASTLYGSDVGGGYEFPGKTYQKQNIHVPGYDTCTSCHNPHTLELRVDECAECHDVDDVEDVVDIRMPGSLVDFDGDGDVEEGIAFELETMRELAYMAIQDYATNVVGVGIVRASNYPYYFVDTNGNGEADEDEAAYANAYNSFTPLLLGAVYNYQVSLADPGGYAHNAVYQIQLLYDTIEALNAQIEEPVVDMASMVRQESGHFDVTAEAWRHWDEDGEVSGRCSRCHTSEGLPFFLENDTTIAFEPSNSLSCSTCHDSVSEFSLYVVNEIEFPSGMSASFGEEEVSNVCLACHQGRASGNGIQSAIDNAGVGWDEVSDSLRFTNPHYFAAGATKFGADVEGAYQFEGKEYNGYFPHTRRVQTCDSCHNVHTLQIDTDRCADCHEVMEDEGADPHMIRLDDEYDPVDYDGDGDVEEPIADEIQTLEDALFAEIQDYAANVIGTPIAYDSHSYPYWFVDANGNGVVDEDESERYPSWSPTLLVSVYNYLWVAKDPGSFAHNPDYILQVLYDSLENIGGEEAVANFTRAPFRPAEED